MTDNEPDDYEDSPDWYGRKTKRKRDFSGRRAMVAPFAFGFLVALVMLVCGGLALFTSGQLDKFVAVQATYVASPTTTSTVTPTLMPSPTVTPTFTPTRMPLVTPQRLPGILFYNSDNPDSKERLEIPMPPLDGYAFRGLHLDNQQHLYVAHTRGFESGEKSCDLNAREAYWVFDLNNYHVSNYIANPRMTAPKRIDVDVQGNSYVVALDCGHPQPTAAIQPQPTIFNFDAQSQLVSTFSVVGVEDVVVLKDSRIVVSLRFPCTTESAMQQHLIVLLPNAETDNWPQSVKGGSDDCNAAYHSMILFDNNLYLIRSAPNQIDRLMVFPVAACRK